MENVTPNQNLSTPPDESSLNNFFKRPLYIGSTACPLTYGTKSTLHPLTAYVGAGTVSQRLQNYQNIRCTVCVKIEMPVTPHYFGEVFCLLQPSRTFLSGQTLYSETYFQVEPSGVFNVNTGVPVVLRFPYFNGYDRLPIQSTTLTDTHCELDLINLSPCGRDDAVSFGTPNLNIYVWLEDVELLDPTPYLTVGGPVKPEPTPGPVSTFMGALSSGMRMMIPFYPPLAAPAAVVDQLGLIAGKLGFSKPNVEHTVTHVNTRPTYLATGIGVETGAMLAINPDNNRPVNPAIGDIPDDQLSFEFWNRKWGYIGNLTYGTATTTGSLLGALPVIPFVGSANQVPIPSAIPYLASQAWVGSMEYRISVAATPFHRGKLLVLYSPSTATSSNVSIATALLNSQAIIFDIAQSSDLVFRVGWTQPTRCLNNAGYSGCDITKGNTPLYVGGLLTLTVGAVVPIANLVGTNGQIFIYAVDPLLATAAGSLQINIWARAGPDMQYYGGQGSLSGLFTVIGGPVADETAPFELGDFQLDATPPLRHIGGSLVPPGQMFRMFGDESLSFRPLLKRMTYYMSLMPYTAAPTNTNYLTVNTQLPLYPPVPRQNPATTLYKNYSTNVGVAAFPPTLFGLLSSWFAGIGGSMNHKVMWPAHSSNTCHLTAYLADTTAMRAVQPYTTFNSTANVTQANAISRCYASARSGMGADILGPQLYSGAFIPIEVTVPHRHVYPFIANQSVTDNQYPCYGLVLSYENDTNGLAPQYDCYCGIGEDFNVFRFQGTTAIGTVASGYETGWTATQ